MSTKYDDILDPFYKRLTSDYEFFEFKGLSVQEANALLETRGAEFLHQAIGYMTRRNKLDVDLGYDDDTRLVNDTLTKDEIDLMVTVMFTMYLRSYVPALKPTTNYFSSMDLKMFSPANERSTYTKMYEYMKDCMESELDSYAMRDRITGEMKTIAFPSVTGV